IHCVMTNIGCSVPLHVRLLLQPLQCYSFFFFSSRRRHTRSVSAFLLNRSSDLKPLQLKLLTTYIPKTSAFTLAFSTSQRLRTTRASARTFFTFRHYITPSARNF